MSPDMSGRLSHAVSVGSVQNLFSQCSIIVVLCIRLLVARIESSGRCAV